MWSELAKANCLDYKETQLIAAGIMSSTFQWLNNVHSEVLHLPRYYQDILFNGIFAIFVDSQHYVMYPILNPTNFN